MVFLRFVVSTEINRMINRERDKFEHLLRDAVRGTRSVWVEPRDIVISVVNSITVAEDGQQVVRCEVEVTPERWATSVIRGLMMNQVKDILCQLLGSSVRVIVTMNTAEGLVVLDSDPTPEPESILTPDKPRPPK